MESKTIPNSVDTQNIVNLKKALLKLKNKLTHEFIQRVNIKEDGWKENETASTGVLRIIENKETKFGEQSYSNWVKCMGRFLDKIIWLCKRRTLYEAYNVKSSGLQNVNYDIFYTFLITSM